jgi:hypothetical protein
MNRILFTLTLATMLASLATAQDNKTAPSVTLQANTQTISAQPASGSATLGKPPRIPSFCPPSDCLYYAGDFDSSASNANGLFNADDTGAGEEGQVWVGVKPDHDVSVTGATFVQFVSTGFGLTNPTPFVVQVGIKPGQAGQTVCNTNGTATLQIECENFGYSQCAITIDHLAKSCKLKKDQVYYVNMLPTSSDGYSYVVNVTDKHPKHHYGWKNDLNDCYFNGAVFGDDYVTCNSQGAFPELSIALTGKNTK